MKLQLRSQDLTLVAFCIALVARAHWPSDLLAGGAVGTAWLTVCLALWRSRRNRQS